MYDDEMDDGGLLLGGEYGGYMEEGEYDEQGGMYGDEMGAGGSNAPHILVLGLKRSGKSSILKVVFNRLSPHETRHLESTKAPEKCNVGQTSFIKFDVWDYPGQLDWEAEFDMTAVFEQCGAIIWVCDSQENVEESVDRYLKIVKEAYAVNPEILFEFFIHKSDGISEDSKIAMQHQISQRCSDELHAAGMENAHTETHLTSIYDHTIYEAFSKVVQQMIPQLGGFGRLLDNFNSSCDIDHSFITDTATKVFLSCDGNTDDEFKYDVCTDVMDIVSDVLSIYMSDPTQQYVSDTLGPDDDPQVESSVELDNGQVLYMRSLNCQLVLISLMAAEKFKQSGLIDYNFSLLQKAVNDILAFPS